METKKNLFACLLLSLFLTACGGGGGGGDSGNGGDEGAKKLLVRVVTEGTVDRTFQYDNQNRLVADSAMGEGNKIEYEGDDARPSLVTNVVVVFSYISYYRYQYGEDDLLGEPMKYYQTQFLDRNENPYGAEFSFNRHYLNADDREIAYGNYDASSNQFSPSRLPSDYSYDRRGNVLKWSRIIGAHGAYMRETVEYTYDEKKNLASGMATPLWFFTSLGWFDRFSCADNFFSNPNNTLSCTITRGSITGDIWAVTNEVYNYTYDRDGYPTAVDVTWTTLDSQGIETTTNHRKTFEYIPAH